MARKTPFIAGEFYHVYNRGTDKRNVFIKKSDFERFLSLLYFCNQPKPVNLAENKGRTFSEAIEAVLFEREETLAEVAAYCLMPNHFHLLIREKTEGGVSKFMQKLLTGYTIYFNKHEERTGALFQGKFKASHVNTDRYFSYLVSYIHLNPIKLIEPTWKETGIVDRERAEKYLETYRPSSYIDYLGKERPENIILCKEALFNVIHMATDFKSAVTEWLAHKKVEPF